MRASILATCIALAVAGCATDHTGGVSNADVERLVDACGSRPDVTVTPAFARCIHRRGARLFCARSGLAPDQLGLCTQHVERLDRAYGQCGASEAADLTPAMKACAEAKAPDSIRWIRAHHIS